MKWKKLQHNGILFPPEYEKQGIKIKIQGDTIDLDINQEEMVYQWAKKKDTPYAQDKVFQKNFTGDFAETLDSKFKKISYENYLSKNLRVLDSAAVSIARDNEIPIKIFSILRNNCFKNVYNNKQQYSEINNV